MRTRFVVVTVLLLAAGAASAAELGRMFFTPEQRATLDKSRRQSLRPEPVPEFKAPPPPLPQNVSVTGLIRRSDGKHTIWLNNHVVDERQTSGIHAGISRRDNHVRLRVPDDGKSVDLKVGQTLEIVSGSIGENYARRAPADAAASVTAAKEDSPPDVSKVTPLLSREPVKSESLAQKRAARAAERNAADDARFNSESEPK